MFRTGRTAAELLKGFKAQDLRIEKALERAAERTKQTKRQIEPFQAAALYLLADMYRDQPCRVLEIGTAYGYSAAILAEALPDAEIITLNPKANEVVAATASLTPHYPNVKILQMTSVEYLATDTGMFDFIFVDGDHKRVKNDFPFWDRLNPGGLMLFHDYSPAGCRRECPPVYEALNELAAAWKHPFDVLIVDSDQVGMAGFYKGKVKAHEPHYAGVKTFAPEPDLSGIITFDDPQEVLFQMLAKYSTNDAEYLEALSGLCGLVADVPGAALEVGVTNGGTAAILGLTGRYFIGIDTFRGIPQPGDEDSPRCHWKWEGAQKTGGWCVGDPFMLERCWKTAGLERDTNHIFHQGDVTRLNIPIPETGLAILHIDATIYRSTKAALERYYQCLNPGGIVIVNAYDYWGGVRRATDAFLKTIPVKSQPFLKQHLYWRKPDATA